MCRLIEKVKKMKVYNVKESRLWGLSKYDSSNTTSRKWEGTKKFHDLMCDMQKIYVDIV